MAKDLQREQRHLKLAAVHQPAGDVAAGVILLVPPTREESGLNVNEMTLGILDQLVDDCVHYVLHRGEEVLVDRDLHNIKERPGAVSVSPGRAAWCREWCTQCRHFANVSGDDSLGYCTYTCQPVSSWVCGTMCTLILPWTMPSLSFGVTYSGAVPSAFVAGYGYGAPPRV